MKKEKPMKKIKMACLSCGQPMPIDVIEPADVGQSVGEWGLINNADIGITDGYCQACDMEYDCHFLEDRLAGKLAGYCICLETGVEVENFLRVILTENEQAKRIAREVLEQ